MDTNSHINLCEDYVSFEVAKLLKEKGFDSMDCKNSPHYSYNADGQFSGPSWDSEYSAPTLQMAMKWLREVHNLHIDVDPSEGNWNPTVLELEDWTCAVKFGDNIPIQDSYKEAVEEAIKYCLTNLIK